MQREQLLVGMLVALLTATLVALAFTPQAVASNDEPVRQADLDIEEIQITTERVGGETIDVSSDARLDHAGGVSKNVTVEFRAVDLDTEMVVDTQVVNVGDLRADREVPVRSTLSVDRDGDYMMEAVVYRDGQRLRTGAREIRGTDSLTPEYADTPVQFHRFAGQDLPVIEYSVVDAGDNRTELSASTHITNTGDSPSDDVRLVFKARQTDSNVVAAQQEVAVNPIDPGQTATPGTTMTVPDGYNYYLDAVLWKDGVIIGTARSGAQLDPTETVSENTTTRESDFEAGDFVESTDQPPEDTPTQVDGDGGAGFGIGIALLAVLTAAIAVTRRDDD